MKNDKKNNKKYLEIYSDLPQPLLSEYGFFKGLSDGVLTFSWVGLKNWKPENYGKKFYGPSTLRTGLEKSRNLMTVRVAQKLGIERIVNFSKGII